MSETNKDRSNLMVMPSDDMRDQSVISRDGAIRPTNLAFPKAYHTMLAGKSAHHLQSDFVCQGL